MTEAGAPLGDPDRVFDRICPAVLRQAWDSSPALIAVTLGPEHALVYQNQAARAMFGGPPLGTPLRQAFSDANEAAVLAMSRVLETGRPVEVPRRRVGVRDLTGGAVVLRYVLAPLGPPGKSPDGVVISAVDITAEARAEQAVARSRLLADLSARLTAASGAAAGLRALVDALVPDLTDVAAVYVLPEGGDRTDPGHTDPGHVAVPPYVVAVSDQLARLGPPPPPAKREEQPPWTAALRSGQPILLPVNAASLPWLAPSPGTASWLTAAGTHTIAVAPLVVAGSLIGALALMATGDRAAYGEGDLPFLTDVAARAGVAIGQLRNQHRHREVALRLQRALLPAAPPELPGVTVAARYLAGSPETEVGGDWWDVQDLGQGRVGIGIGDVSGRGISAAAVMGQARAAMRAAGHAQLPPATVLSLLDAQLHEVTSPGRLSEPTSPRFATACYGVIDLAGGSLRVANAGHLPPLIRSTTGAVRAVQLPPAAPLGLRIGGFTETTVPLAPGETLVMFTDGLVETRHQDLRAGIAALAGALERLGAQPNLDTLADQLLAAMRGRPGHGHDDTALVLTRPDPAR